MLTVLFYRHHKSYDDHNDVHLTDNNTMAEGGGRQSQDIVLVDFYIQSYHF